MERSRVLLKELNLICALCGGYFIDATTIVECCHTFCKTCIVKHITCDNADISKDTGKKRNGTEKFCPMCEVQLHKTKPLLSLRLDDRIQRLVYKAVPKLYEEEVKRRYLFYAERNLEDTPECEREMEAILQYNIFHPKDMFSICLEYYNESKSEESEENEEPDPNDVHRRYLRCPAQLTIHHLKKFLRMKFLLTVDHPVHIYYKGKKRKGLEDKEEEVLLETYSLMDVAYIFEWDPKASPMKFGYQILKRQVVVKPANINRVMVAESSSSSPLKETVMHGGPDNIGEEQSEQSGQMRDLRLGKKKLREHSDTFSEDSPVPMKRLRKKSVGSERNFADEITDSTEVIGVSSKHNISRSQEVTETVTVEDSNDTSEFSVREEKGDISQPASNEESVVPEDDDVMVADEVSQTAESVEEQQDISQDIEEVVVDIDGEPSQDFILQEEQAMEASEELEEDDDEDRLRICDPEEIPEDRVSEDYVEEKVEESPAQPDVEEEETKNCVEEEAEVARKESKSRRKNKKAKHHHRHRRDYSPAPEATIVSSDDKSDSLKLKVKITRSDSETSQGKNRSKQDDSSRYYKLSDGHNSPRQSKHKNYVISEGIYNNSEQSPLHSNNDEDSRHSHSTDDHEVRSIASSKEGHDEVATAKGSPMQNGNMDPSKTNSLDIANKEKLNQLRQVRHKNITPPPPRTLPNTTISKVSAEEASKNSFKSLLTSTTETIVTLQKVTAEEAEEKKVKTYNNLESKRPSLEIIPVVGSNNASSVNKTNENKSILSQNKQMILPGGNPVVKLMKNNLINSLSSNQKSSLLSKVKCTNVDISNNSEVFRNSKECKVAAEKKTVNKKRESSGVLDLSEKSTRSSCSSPASEGSNSPSPHQPVLSLTQPLINRHLAAMNSPRRSSSSSPPVTASIPKGSPTRPMHPAYLSDLMTLSDTAVHIRNIKAAHVQEGIRRQVSASQNRPSPQRYPSMPSPGKSPSRVSPTQLKIPTPNLSSKFASRPKLPTNPTSLPNRPVAVNRPIVPSSRVVAGRTINVFPNMMSSHSAAVAKKQADINGRTLNIPPPPPVIPISSLYKMEKMARKFDLEKIARAISAENKAKAKGLPYIPKQVSNIQESTVPKIPSS